MDENFFCEFPGSLFLGLTGFHGASVSRVFGCFAVGNGVGCRRSNRDDGTFVNNSVPIAPLGTAPY